MDTIINVHFNSDLVYLKIPVDNGQYLLDGRNLSETTLTDGCETGEKSKFMFRCKPYVKDIISWYTTNKGSTIKILITIDARQKPKSQFLFR